MREHFTIPVFIPHRACPNRCIFCDQQKITGNIEMPKAAEIQALIERNLATMPADAHIEIGFFGGTFTGMPHHEQEYYLATAQPYLESGRIKGIRLSTRPDFIDEAVLELLKKYHVSLIELGAQSMDDAVLAVAERGHTADDVRKASHMIKSAGFALGLQMMVGLPGDDAAADIRTAESFAALEADCVRIYPVLVIKGTALEGLYRKKIFQPLSLDEAAERTAVLLEYFISKNIAVIRVGLHVSEEMKAGQEVVAGPVHSSFREIAMTKAWARKFAGIAQSKQKKITIFVGEQQYNTAIGYGGANKKSLQLKYQTVKFRTDNNLNGMEFYVDYS
ncbi:MAG: radical SAM protein [Bacteroidota bacterium]